jgi:hypothetical protein
MSRLNGLVRFRFYDEASYEMAMIEMEEVGGGPRGHADKLEIELTGPLWGTLIAELQQVAESLGGERLLAD